MKTVELSRAQFDFLGSLLSHHLTGRHSEVEQLYSKFKWLNDDMSFDELSVDTELSRPGTLYLKGKMVGRVISFNIPEGHNESVCQAEIAKIINRLGGEVIDV